MRTMDQAFEAYERGERAEARQVCREVLAQSPDDADALFLSAVMAAEDGDIEIAKAVAKRAIEVAPSRADGRFYLGTLYAQGGEHEQAIPWYTSAIDREGHWEYRSALGSSLVSVGEYQTAIEQFELAIAAQPRSADLWALLGSAYLRWGQPQAALQGYLVAEAQTPNDPDVKCLLATAYTAIGDIAKATKALLDALAIQPDHLTAKRKLRDLPAAPPSTNTAQAAAV